MMKCGKCLCHALGSSPIAGSPFLCIECGTWNIARYEHKGIGSAATANELKLINEIPALQADYARYLAMGEASDDR